jgi:hypothetical protein
MNFYDIVLALLIWLMDINPFVEQFLAPLAYGLLYLGAQ